jgi:hypothetical protein
MTDSCDTDHPAPGDQLLANTCQCSSITDQSSDTNNVAVVATIRIGKCYDFFDAGNDSTIVRRDSSPNRENLGADSRTNKTPGTEVPGVS